MKEVEKIFTDEEKEVKIKKELKNLRVILKQLSKEQKTVCLPLLENIAFCIIQLEELREMIKRDGYFETYQNGENQWGTKETICSKQYLSIGKLYTNYLAKLKEYIPQGIVTEDKLDAFKKKHKK